MRAAGQVERLERELADLSGRVDGHGQSLAREFDHVLDVLDRRGYVDADAWTLTDRGEALSRVFHESDLLVAECVLGGVFDGLDAATLAGLLSVFVYEHRSPEPPPPPWFPSKDARERWRGSWRSARTSPPTSGRAASPSTARPIPGSSAPPTRGSRGRAWPRSSATRS